MGVHWPNIFFKPFWVLQALFKMTVGFMEPDAVTRIRTGVAAATTQSTNLYTITATELLWNDKILEQEPTIVHVEAIARSTWTWDRDPIHSFRPTLCVQVTNYFHAYWKQLNSGRFLIMNDIAFSRNRLFGHLSKTNRRVGFYAMVQETPALFPYRELNPGRLGENQESWPLDHMGLKLAEVWIKKNVGMTWCFLLWRHWMYDGNNHSRAGERALRGGCCTLLVGY